MVLRDISSASIPYLPPSLLFPSFKIPRGRSSFSGVLRYQHRSFHPLFLSDRELERKPLWFVTSTTTTPTTTTSKRLPMTPSCLPTILSPYPGLATLPEVTPYMFSLEGDTRSYHPGAAPALSPPVTYIPPLFSFLRPQGLTINVAMDIGSQEPPGIILWGLQLFFLLNSS